MHINQHDIVYYIGAGASINAVPLVSKMDRGISNAINQLIPKKALISFNPPQFQKDGFTIESAFDELIHTWKWLSLNANPELHTSIDTFAKKLIITRARKDYIRLKAGLITFFDFIQRANPPDIRYDSFIASLIHISNKDLPKNIKIITWNYDMQLEIAYSQYLSTPNLIDVQNRLNMVPSNINDSSTEIMDGFCYIKLNGSAGFLNKDTVGPSYIQNSLKPYIPVSGQNKANDKIDSQYIASLVTTYKYLINEQIQPILNFSWDSQNFYPNPVDIAKRKVKNARVLIVIGYSLPFFNREIDRAIINKMSHLEKIYFQVPENFSNSIMHRFKAISPKLIHICEVYNDVSQFLLPPEL